MNKKKIVNPVVFDDPSINAEGGFLSIICSDLLARLGSARYAGKITGYTGEGEETEKNLYTAKNISLEHDATLELSNKKNLFQGSTMLLLMYIMHKFTQNPVKSIVLTLDFNEFFKMRGLKDRASCKSLFERDLYLLRDTKVFYENKEIEADFNLIQSREHKKNTSLYKIELSNKFYEYLLNKKKPIPIPSSLWKLNPKLNEDEINLVIYIAFQLYINHGCSNDNIFLVETLLNYCPTIPRKEDFKNDRHYEKRQIEALKNKLDHLSVFLNCEFIKYKGTKYTDDELGKITYQEWLKARVHISFKNSPYEKIDNLKKEQKINDKIAKKVERIAVDQGVEKVLKKRAKGLY